MNDPLADKYCTLSILLIFLLSFQVFLVSPEKRYSYASLNLSLYMNPLSFRVVLKQPYDPLPNVFAQTLMHDPKSTCSEHRCAVF